jgi:hypothetical protein
MLLMLAGSSVLWIGDMEIYICIFLILNCELLDVFQSQVTIYRLLIWCQVHLFKNSVEDIGQLENRTTFWRFACSATCFLKITVLRRQGNNSLVFHMFAPKVHAFVTVCHEGIYAFSTEFWAYWMKPVWDSFLDFHSILERVTTKTLLQRVRKMEVSWCKVRAIHGMFWGTLIQIAAMRLSGWVCGVLAPSYFCLLSSEEASWWSQMPDWCGRERSCLTLVPYFYHFWCSQ